MSILRSLSLASWLSLVALASVCSAGVGCGGGGGFPKGAVVQAGGGSAEGSTAAVADDDTWLSLATVGARMKVPAGWRYSRKGDALVAEPVDKKAAIVFVGAGTAKDFEAKVRAVGADYKIDKVDFGKPRPGTLHGIAVTSYEDMVAESNGTPVDVFVMTGDAPKGMVMVFVMAWDETQAHDPAIIDAANSLRPL